MLTLKTILALETTANTGSAALCRGTEILCEVALAEGMKHGRLLIPGVDELLRRVGLGVKDLDFIACGIGPGSYTGSRVGVMAAKALAFGAGIPCIAVSSLAALALQAKGQARYIIPAQDARRDEVYTAVYGFDGGGMPVAERADTALSPEETAALAYDGTYMLAGSALARYPEIFRPLREKGVTLNYTLTAPGAGFVGMIAAARTDTAIDALALEPVYMRRDDAPCTFERFMS